MGARAGSPPKLPEIGGEGCAPGTLGKGDVSGPGVVEAARRGGILTTSGVSFQLPTSFVALDGGGIEEGTGLCGGGWKVWGWPYCWYPPLPLPAP